MRIVELFSGIGSQAKAFEKLKIEHEIVCTCEWDIHAIVAYDLIHNGPELHPDSLELSKSDLVILLKRYTLSSDGKNPMSENALKSIHIDGLRSIYSAILKTNNFVDITQLKGTDIPENIDLMTYSFPCQDLSNVGAFHGYNKGIDRGANNKSGLLWEVERILTERFYHKLDLPKYLLLENVSALLSKRHKTNFEEWQQILAKLGYINHIYCLNAVDFGLPQNRYRLLMLSVRTEGKETKEILETFFNNHNLEDKTYRSKLNIKKLPLSSFLKTDYENPVYRFEAEQCQPNNTISRRRIWERNLQITDSSGKIIVEKVGTLTTKQDRDPNSGNLKVSFNNDKANFRYLTPRECFMLMGFDEDDYQILTDNKIKQKENQFLLTRDKMIRLAGNSIAVNVLMAIFTQMMDIEEVFNVVHFNKRTDVHDVKTRKYNMAQIKGKGTKPERIVSKFLFSKGLRYRLNDKKLPGSPDIVLKKYKTVIFINGCFWHKHENCKYFVWPKSNVDFWKTKINANCVRDRQNYIKLKYLGWKVIVIWECRLKGKNLAETLEDLYSEIIKVNDGSAIIMKDNNDTNQIKSIKERTI